MMTVNEVSKLTGVSIRTLHYYDKIGVLKPSFITEAGYRQYDDAALERLQQILLFRELQFSLKEIKEILESDGFDRNKALEQQIELLTLKKEHLENLIDFAREMKAGGVKKMEFEVFDTTKLDEYAKKAKEQWGKTHAYQEFQQKSKNRSNEQTKCITKNMMGLFAEFGDMMDCNPEDAKVQSQVQKLQEFITQHFYTCTNEILQGLGQMYASGGEFTENIDKVGKKGCAQFVADAIHVFCN